MGVRIPNLSVDGFGLCGHTLFAADTGYKNCVLFAALTPKNYPIAINVQ